MDYTEIINQLEKEVKDYFAGDSSGHDINHLERTKNLALKIQEKEGGNRLVVAVAAYLHDVHRIIQNKSGKYCTPRESLPEVERLMAKVELDNLDRILILNCIAVHEEYNFSSDEKSDESLEAMIVQDADNLDAMGAVGVARAFMYGGAHNMPMWVPDISVVDGAYDESKNDISVIHHFSHKLLKLKNNMNTGIGREMAICRYRFMLEFLAEFKSEWKGNK